MSLQQLQLQLRIDARIDDDDDDEEDDGKGTLIKNAPTYWNSHLFSLWLNLPPLLGGFLAGIFSLSIRHSEPTTTTQLKMQASSIAKGWIHRMRRGNEIKRKEAPVVYSSPYRIFCPLVLFFHFHLVYFYFFFPSSSLLSWQHPIFSHCYHVVVVLFSSTRSFCLFDTARPSAVGAYDTRLPHSYANFRSGSLVRRSEMAIVFSGDVSFSCLMSVWLPDAFLFQQSPSKVLSDACFLSLVWWTCPLFIRLFVIDDDNTDSVTQRCGHSTCYRTLSALILTLTKHIDSGKIFQKTRTTEMRS